jgi:predicted amidohydrolase
MSLTRVAAVQMEPILGEPARNLAAIEDRLRAAASEGSALAVFPECALTGYCFDSLAEARPFAEPPDGPSLSKLGSLCAELGVFAVVGYLESDGDRIFNSCALIGPQGLVGSYRKVHIPFMGVDRFVTPGDRPFTIHEAAGLRVGMHICYDGGFPEAGRAMALMGADLLVLPTNWPEKAEAAALHLTPCRAFENTVYAMAVNRVGTERGTRFIGLSSIADPHGALLATASPDGDEILYADLDPGLARQKLIVRKPGLHQINRIADRRPSFYGHVVEPNGRD